ncbi:hypothetical protein SCH01S_28_00590 [Sphingomonas changbaiensis NBRC 104936]|uniref:PEP-CTERM protein-sorting domain-containing protein n=1 Tax=Sphingomonas changbaiensis NBRC 104936 TaxID=1219043 RepID=A0A0E9MPZ4_9SPHN|nr:PEP-CTERM domain protein [Sphingomonas changbaiensis]GAO39200.1 hypothetical protein SCH01S_28_00590 [Sphingomonas changbaiensis NBRC 104936]
MHVPDFAKFAALLCAVCGAGTAAWGRGAVIDETTGINFANCTDNICEIPLGLTVDFGAGPTSNLFVSSRGLFALGSADLNNSSATTLKGFGNTVFSPAFADAMTSNFLYRGPDPNALNNPNAFKLRYDLTFDNNNFTTVQLIIRPVGASNGFELEYAYGDGSTFVDLGTNTVIGYSFGAADHEVLSGDPGISDRLNDQQNASFLFRFPLAASVPEPSNWAFMLLGFSVAGIAMRRSTKGPFSRAPLSA